MYSFSYLEPVCSMSSSNYCFLTCIQISQEAGQVVWYSHLFQNFPQFIVIHTVKDFGIVNKISECGSHSVMSNSLQPQRIYRLWNSPGQNTGVGSLSLLQGIFPTQGLNLGLPHCRQILYQLSHKGNSRMTEWVAYAFSSSSSWPRNTTRISCIAGGFFTSWADSLPAIREVL